jgi:hypothetical protein
MGVGAAHFQEIGAPPFVQRFRFRLGEEIGGLGRGQHFMRGNADRGQLFRPRRPAAFRHHGRKIPMQDSSRLLQGRQAAELGLQLSIGAHALAFCSRSSFK